jgi:ubiquinone biosynthesis accessory factor UbiJ
MPATPVWLAAVESLLNRGIDESIRAAAAASRLNKTCIALELEGFRRIRIAVCAGHLALASGEGLEADAVIAGSPLGFVDLIARHRHGASGAIGTQRLKITGDAEIVARYRDLIELARPDWEEELSRLVGDLPARRISMAAQSALSWARKFARTASENVSEYLQEESRDLVSKPEIEEFLLQVDELRESADRIEARLARLEGSS